MEQKLVEQKCPGNTSQGTSKFRSWTFTIWDDLTFELFKKLNYTYMVYAPEVCPTTGRKHYQCYAHLQNTRSINSMRKEFKGHDVQVARGSASENRAYIMGPYSKNDKEKPINPDAVELGTLPEQGKRNDLIVAGRKAVATKRERSLLDDEDCWEPLAKYPKFFAKLLSRQWEKEAIELYESGFTPEVYVLWSRTSGTGKSRLVYETHGAENICRGNIASKTGKLWWDSYDGQTVLLLEEFEGQLEYTQWKQLTDRYPIQLEVKGSYTWCVRKRIYFTSNKHPDDWWKLEAIEKAQMDRRITEIREMS